MVEGWEENLTAEERKSRCSFVNGFRLGLESVGCDGGVVVVAANRVLVDSHRGLLLLLVLEKRAGTRKSHIGR